MRKPKLLQPAVFLSSPTPHQLSSPLHNDIIIRLVTSAAGLGDDTGELVDLCLGAAEGTELQSPS